MKKTLLFLLFFTCITSAQWQLRSTGLTNFNIGSLDAIDRNNAVVSSGGIYITSNAGLNWRKIFNSSVIDVVMKSDSLIYAISERAVIRTTNGGAKWDTLYQQPSNMGMLDYIKVFGNTIIVMGDCDMDDFYSPAQIYKSTDGGTTWLQVNKSGLIGGRTWNVWRPVDFGSDSTAIIGYHYLMTPGSNQLAHTFARTSDGGDTWQFNTIPGLQNSPYIYVSKMYDALYGAAYGWDHDGHACMFITNDGGANWETNVINTSNIYGNAICFVPNDPDKIFLSRSDALYYSNDRGKKWTMQNFTPNTTPARIEDIIFVDQDCGWMVTSMGEIYWTDNKGNAVVRNDKQTALPSGYYLEQNYPNPFNPSTKITFSLPKVSRVLLRIYDLLGREIKTLADKELSAGYHSFTWNADDNYGKKVATGIYIYTLSTENFMQTRKMILIK